MPGHARCLIWSSSALSARSLRQCPSSEDHRRSVLGIITMQSLLQSAVSAPQAYSELYAPPLTRSNDESTPTDHP